MRAVSSLHTPPPPPALTVPSGRGPLSQEVGQVAGEAFEQLLEGTGKGAAGGRARS